MSRLWGSFRIHTDKQRSKYNMAYFFPAFFAATRERVICFFQP